MSRYNALKVGLQKVHTKGIMQRKKSCHQLDLDPQSLERQADALQVELQFLEERSPLHLCLQLTLQSKWNHV